MSLIKAVDALFAEDKVEAWKEAEEDDVDDDEVEAEEVDDGFCEQEFDRSGYAA